MIHGGTASSIFSAFDFLNYMGPPGFTLSAGMAELPEIVDQTTLIYRIKPNVFWHDKPPTNGRQFTAEDAAFGLRRFGQDNPQFVFKSRFDLVAQFEAVDDLTLRIISSQPFSPLLSSIAEESSLMVAPDVVEAFGDQAISEDFDKVIGTGPFMPEKRESEVETVFVRNPNYYREGQPYFDRFRVLWFADAALRVAAFVNGQLDFLNAHWTGSLQDFETAQAELGQDEVTGVPNPVSFGTATHFNTKVPPYDDKRVRKALHLALDREQLNAVGSGGRSIGGPIAVAVAPYGWTEDELRGRPGYREGAEREGDLTEARQLLDATGVDLDNLPAMQVWTASSDFGQIMQQNWNDIGFRLDIEELATGDALAARSSREGFSIMTLGQAGGADPDLLFNDLHTDGAQNYGDFSEPEIDAALEKGRTTFGTAERKEIYDDLQELLLEEYNPRLWWNWSQPTVSFRSYAKGFRPTSAITAGNITLAGMWFDGKPA